MIRDREPTSYPERPQIYQIVVEGYLDDAWADWFDGVTLTGNDGGETTLTTQPVDQAALHGLLKRVRDLGLPLLSVNRITSELARSGVRR